MTIGILILGGYYITIKGTIMLNIIDGDVLVYMSIWGSNTLEEAKTKFGINLNDVVTSTFSTDYVMAIGGPDNFRIDLYSEYKGNRKKAKDNRPNWFGDLKSWVVNHYDGAIETDNCEADDIVRVWALEADEACIPRVVTSVDKDLDCIAGNHYNPRTRVIYQICEERAERFYWQQILTGDSVDNIPGLFRCGPVKAKKILEDSLTHNELMAAVCVAYEEAYGDEGYAYMTANGRLIHIWRKVDDYFHIEQEVYRAAIANRDRALELQQED